MIECAPDPVPASSTPAIAISIARLALAVTAVMSAAAPAMAQEEAVPLLRVYTEAPYYYDYLADVGQALPDQHYPLRLYLDGKEVGQSNIVFNCGEGTWEEEVLTEWSGGSADFIGAALTSFSLMYCGG